MKIVFLDAKTLGEGLDLKKFAHLGELEIFQKTSVEDLIDNIGEAEIIVTNKCVMDKNVMEACPALKLICISATGMNNVDLDAAKTHGIVVKNAVGYSSESVAQHTFAAIFKLYNQLDYYDKYVKDGYYAESDIFTHYGPTVRNLSGKTFGIIGMGNIGKTVANIATAFGCQVAYYSTTGKNNSGNYSRLSLDELLATSDIISIHAPLNADTTNLISHEQMNRMKSNAILVNVGRGGIVDEQALADAIEGEKIGGACVDVFPNEPILANNPLLGTSHGERLVLSPHIAWASIEARQKLMDIVYENIEVFLKTGA